MSFNFERLDWNAVRLFIEVADAGTLALAADRTGVSAPTLHRRMVALENSLDAQLFLRRPTGYSLTSRGEELRALADDASTAMARIGDWRTGQTDRPPLRIACGPWTSLFVGDMAARISAGLNGRTFRLVIGTSQTDLTRRQADIGLRNTAPTQLGLAGQRVANVAFAVYAGPDLSGQAKTIGIEHAYASLPWIALDGERPTASSRYLASVLGSQPVATSDHPMPLLHMAVSGVGLCLLPCFVGDRTPGLDRVGDPLPALRQEQWLVTADTRRHDPLIRAGLTVLKRIWNDRRGTFAGQA
jgi:DNA-binding transcriptional LysR family regulator